MKTEDFDNDQNEGTINVEGSDVQLQVKDEEDTKQTNKMGLYEMFCGRRDRKCFSLEWWKYFWCRGQIKKYFENENGKEEPPEGSSWFYRHIIWNRSKLVSIFGMFTIVFVAWIIVMGCANLWWIFKGNAKKQIKPGWYASLTMVFGSIIGGGTAEGGGAIAYPVFTLVIGVKPIIARNFTLMIQTVGMGSACLVILYMEILLCDVAVVFCSLGGTFGLIIGIAWIVPHLTPAYSKLFFVSFFLAFAINLFILNLYRGRYVRKQIKDPNFRDYLILLVTGFAGGIVSSVSGTGIDVTVFSVLTLIYRVDEKVASPTTVVIQAINTSIGFLYIASRGMIDTQTWVFFGSACWIVSLGAPFGAFISSFLHRQILAGVVYVLDIAQFITACVIIKFVKNDYIVVFVTLFGSLGFFFLLRLIGNFITLRDENVLQETRV